MPLLAIPRYSKASRSSNPTKAPRAPRVLEHTPRVRCCAEQPPLSRTTPPRVWARRSTWIPHTSPVAFVSEVRSVYERNRNDRCSHCGRRSLSLSCGLSFALSHAVINIIHRARTQPTSSRSKHSDLERMDVAMQTCFSSLSLSLSLTALLSPLSSAPIVAAPAVPTFPAVPSSAEWSKSWNRQMFFHVKDFYQ